MAPRATEFIELLAPYPGRAEFAIRLALICALTVLVAEIYQIPDPALTTYIAFFVMKPDRMSSIVISIVLVILISLIIGMVMLVTMAVVDDAMWRVIAMTLISFVLMFLGSASKLKPVAGIVALIAIYGLDLVSIPQIGEITTRALLYVWLFVATPAGVSIAVNLLIGPAPRRLVAQALAYRLRLSAAMLQGPDARSRDAFATLVHEGPGEIPEWLERAAAEKTAPPEDIAALRQAADSTFALGLLVAMIPDDPNGTLPQPLRARLARHLEEMAAILEKGSYPVDTALPDCAADEAVAPTAAAILAELEELLAGFAIVPRPDPAPEAKAKGGFFLPDAFRNPAHVQYALKSTAAAMTCYITYSLLDWRDIHTCLITSYIVALGTTGETVEKLALRLVGAALGAASGLAAIVFLMPDVTSIGGLMAIVFLVGFVSAWIAAGGPRIGYAGFQLAFAFFLCVIQGAAPAFDLAIARDRVIGILFGNLVVYLVFTHIWPVSVAPHVDHAIAALLRRLSGLLTAAGRSRRTALARAAQTELAALDGDLALARYEPAAIRPAGEWLDSRSRAAEALAALAGPLLVSATQAPGSSRDLAQRLDALAAALDGQSQPAQATAPRGADQVTGALVEPELRRLTQALAGGAPPAGMDLHATA